MRRRAYIPGRIARERVKLLRMTELRSYVEQAAIEMRNEYERIQRRVSEDPGTAGDEGEVNWAELLKRWLPQHYHVRTKGRVLGSLGAASKQVDVIVLYPEYPTGLLEKKLYLASGVAAVFECKLTLRQEHLASTVARAAEFQDSLGLRSGSPRKEMFGPIAYGLLAHSHEWKRPNSEPARNVDEGLREADQAIVNHPRQMLDFVCVSDLGAWTAHKSCLFGGPRAQAHQRSDDFPSGYALTSFMERSVRIEERHSRTNGAEEFDTKALAIGEFLTSLLARLAYEDTRLQAVAWSLRGGQFSRTGMAQCRAWDVTRVLSDRVCQRLLAQNPQESMTVWDEWCPTWA